MVMNQHKMISRQLFVFFIVIGLLFAARESQESAQCDVELDGTICLFNGEKILVPTAKMPGLLLHYSFDDGQNLDLSGNGNHPVVGKPIPKGPSFGGSGNSAFFSGSSFMKFHIPEDMFKPNEFSVQFYFFPVEEQSMSGKVECAILHKGVDNTVDGKYERSPGIYFNKNTHQIKVYMSTVDKLEYPEGEFIESNARLPMNKWAHIVLSKSGSKVKLFVNGVLDNIAILMNFDVANDSAFHLGNVPWETDNCSLHAYIDELKILSVETKSYEVQAEASSFLGGVEPNFLHLGCTNCPLQAAKQSCITGYHLCTSIELYSGAYTAAKALGWVELSRNIWTYNQLFTTTPTTEKQPSSSEQIDAGLAICCADLDEPNQQ